MNEIAETSKERLYLVIGQSAIQLLLAILSTLQFDSVTVIRPLTCISLIKVKTGEVVEPTEILNRLKRNNIKPTSLVLPFIS